MCLIFLDPKCLQFGQRFRALINNQEIYNPILLFRIQSIPGYLLIYYLMHLTSTFSPARCDLNLYKEKNEMRITTDLAVGPVLPRFLHQLSNPTNPVSSQIATHIQCGREDVYSPVECLLPLWLMPLYHYWLVYVLGCGLLCIDLSSRPNASLLEPALSPKASSLQSGRKN